MTSDLFDAFPDDPAGAAPPPPPPAPPPAPVERPARLVASFTCPCGAQEEVRESAPETVNCWGCKKPLGMRRWVPSYEPPLNSARKATEAELLRVGVPAKPAKVEPAAAKSAAKPKAERVWKRNPGHLPEDAKGRRVVVRFTNGEEYHGDPNPMSPPGWAADGRHGMNWTRRGLPIDVDFYSVVK